MKNKFKFDLNEKVMRLGHAGICIVTGRGELNFVSGGKLNFYQIMGAHNLLVAEYELLSLSEANTLYV